MATNVLGYDRSDTTARLISSDYAAISFGTSEVGLVQSAQLNYGHQVIPRFEAGSSNLYWVTGQAQGRITVQRAVSSKGLFGSIDVGEAAKGTLAKFSLKIEDAGFTAGGNIANVSGDTNINFSGGVIVNITASVQTGNLDVSEGVEIAFAEMDMGGAGGNVVV